MANNLNNKIVVITGSTRGFGLAIARAALKAGATVVITGRNQEAVDRVLNGMQAADRTAGFVVDDKTDLQANYFFYVAKDFVGDPAFGQPYGADAEEHGVTVTLTRKLTKNLRLTTKYGYYRFQDNASGTHNNYDAHLIYSSLHCRF